MSHLYSKPIIGFIRMAPLFGFHFRPKNKEKHLMSKCLCSRFLSFFRIACQCYPIQHQWFTYPDPSILHDRSYYEDHLEIKSWISQQLRTTGYMHPTCCVAKCCHPYALHQQFLEQ